MRLIAEWCDTANNKLKTNEDKLCIQKARKSAGSPQAFVQNCASIHSFIQVDIHLISVRNDCLLYIAVHTNEAAKMFDISVQNVMNIVMLFSLAGVY